MNYDLPHFSIDRGDFMKGGNSFDSLPDGGIQKSYYGYNAFYKPGVLTVCPSLGSSVDSTIKKLAAFGMAMGKNAGSTPVMLAMGTDATDGYYYSVDPTTGAFTKVGATDTGHSYSKIVTHSVWYNSSFFTTYNGGIAKNSADLATRDLPWWTTTKSMTALDAGGILVPHPMVVFGDIMYIADGRYVHQNDHDTCQYDVLDLGPDWVITDMKVFNNQIFIAAEPYYNSSGSYHGRARMFTWDGVSASWISEFPLDYRVNAMFSFDQTLYMFTNDWLGYWDGFRMKRLYPMAGQILQHQICSTSDSMFFVDPTTTPVIVRMGAPSIVGAHRFHRFLPYASSQLAGGIFSPYQNALLATQNGSSVASNFYISNVNTPGSPTFAWRFNRRRFSRPVKIRGIVIELYDNLASGQSVYVQYIDDTGTSITTPAVMQYSTVEHRAPQSWRFDIVAKKAVRFLDPYITVTGGALVQNVDFLYEASEAVSNK